MRKSVISTEFSNMNLYSYSDGPIATACTFAASMFTELNSNQLDSTLGSAARPEGEGEGSEAYSVVSSPYTLKDELHTK